MKHLWLAAAAPVLLGAAQPNDAATERDLRCLTASFAMVGSGKEDQKTAGMFTAIYFLGRLDGRVPALNLEAEVAKQAQALTPEQLSADLKDCAGTMESRGKDLITLGQNLQKRGL